MLAAVLSLLFGLGGPAVPQPSPLHIYWIDAEGGGATLVVTPTGESILIDAGENLDRDASLVQEVATKIAGVKQIDYFIATQWGADHYGGAIELGKRIPILFFLGGGPLPDGVPEDPQFSKLMPLYKGIVKGNSITLKPGDTFAIRQSVIGPVLHVQVLAASRRAISSVGRLNKPNPLCRERENDGQDATKNEKSIVLLFRYGKFAFLDGGDLTRAMEEQLVCPRNSIGTVKLFQIDHHGLDLSNSPVLIHSIHPRMVLVNNGPLKGAEPMTMKNLFSAPGIESVWQIHRNLQTGAQITTSELIANQEADGRAEFIQAWANRNGEFSVQIGSNGPLKSYPTR